MKVDDDSQLVTRAATGDRAAFDALARACRPWLYGLCFRLVRDRVTAEDLAQDTLIQAFRDLRQLRDASRFRAWLSRVAVNTCRMHLRREARSLQLTPEVAVPSGRSDSPLAVDDALARLDSTQRRLLRLFYTEELSHAEIAETLALSASAVKSRLHRAREQLRKEMLAMMSDDEKARLGGAEAPPWRLRTILLVEPDGALREPLRQALTDAGYQVVVLPTGEAALVAARERRGDLLLLDKHCGEPHWIEVLTLLQAEAWSRENLPVGVFVAPDSERDIFAAWQAGAQLCLTRPFRVEEVVGLVEKIAQLWPEQPHRPCGPENDG